MYSVHEMTTIYYELGEPLEVHVHVLSCVAILKKIGLALCQRVLVPPWPREKGK